MNEITVEVFVYRDGEPYDSMVAIGQGATVPINEARHWLGNAIDNDPSLTIKQPAPDTRPRLLHAGETE